MLEAMASDTAATNRPPNFEVRPAGRIERIAEPAAALVEHLASTAGQFDRLSAATDPSHITASDIVAVSMLGQPLPPASAAWILGDEGQWLTAEILAHIPATEHLHSYAASSIFKMAELFHLLRSPQAQIPDRRRAAALGQATTTRLLVTKRPHLVPIDDRDIRNVLGYSKDDLWWKRWPSELTKETRDRLDDIRTEAAVANPLAAKLSDLRIFDILLRV